MRMGNHVIRFELLSALLHSNLCQPYSVGTYQSNSAPLSFFIASINTWLQVCSRFAAFLTPRQEREVAASKPAWIKSSVNLSYLVVFLSKIERGLSAPLEEFLLALLARRLPLPGPAFAQ